MWHILYTMKVCAIFITPANTLSNYDFAREPVKHLRHIVELGHIWQTVVPLKQKMDSGISDC
jgi:hypothetical protein